jgi:cytochrome c biogenesis protein CcdA
VGSLVDAFRFKKTGKSSDMMLGLSSGTHRGIHEKIRTLAYRSALLLFPASIVLGAVVSSMELACTGQVYAPLLAAMLAQGMTPRFLFLLLVYNLCFILPLAIITVLACRGVGAQALANWAKEHVFATKLLMAAIFTIIAAVMVVLLILRV